MTEKRIQKLKRKLQDARFRLYERVPEFAAPLYSMLFAAVDTIPRMSTNGACIYVNPGWLQGLPPVSLELMLGHQLMHIELGHIDRPRYYAGERFHLACDIIANSHLRTMGYAYDTLPRVGTLFHETFYPPTEGLGLTPEEAFALQGFPKEMAAKARISGISEHQLYKEAGNAASVNVIYAILYYLVVSNNIMEW